MLNNSVRFSAGPITKATDVAWEADDRLGVFAYDGTTATVSNAQYIITDQSNGTMSVVTNDDRIFYPVGKSLSFYGYYPYSTTTVSGTAYTVDTTDQSTTEKVKALDLMWASMESQNTTNVSLPFVHKMVKLHFDILTGAYGVTNLTGMTATLCGANATATFDLKTGTLSDLTSEDINLNVVFDANKTKATIDALVLPTGMAAMSNVQLVLNIGDKKFSWKPATAVWVSGESYTYKILSGLPFEVVYIYEGTSIWVALRTSRAVMMMRLCTK